MLRQPTDQELFDADIIAELGLQDLSDDKKTQLIQTIVSLVQKSSLTKILDLLSEDERKELEALIEEKGADSPTVILFMQSRVTNLEEIFKTELIAVKRDLIMAHSASGA